MSKMLIMLGCLVLGFGTGQHNKGKKLPFFPWAIIALLFVLVGILEGCATLPHAPPVGIWEGGMNLDGIHEACTIEPQPNGDSVIAECPR